jgi:hypothetical protein
LPQSRRDWRTATHGAACFKVTIALDSPVKFVENLPFIQNAKVMLYGGGWLPCESHLLRITIGQ